MDIFRCLFTRHLLIILAIFSFFKVSQKILICRFLRPVTPLTRIEQFFCKFFATLHHKNTLNTSSCTICLPLFIGRTWFRILIYKRNRFEPQLSSHSKPSWNNLIFPFSSNIPIKETIFFPIYIFRFLYSSEPLFVNQILPKFNFLNFHFFFL